MKKCTTLFEVWVEIWKIICNTWRKYLTAEVIEFNEISSCESTTFEFGSAHPGVFHAWLNLEYGCGPALIQTPNLKWAEQNVLNFYNAVYRNAGFFPLNFVLLEQKSASGSIQVAVINLIRPMWQKYGVLTEPYWQCFAFYCRIFATKFWR